MASNLKTYQYLSFIVGILGYLFFFVYADSLNVMYATKSYSFNQMFNGLTINSLLIGAMIPIRSLHGGLSFVGLSTLFALSLVCVLSGLFFSYSVKTEEFLIYFLLTSTTTLVFLGIAASFTRFILFRTELSGKHLIQLFFLSLAGVGVGFALNILLISIEPIYTWSGILVLLMISFYMVKRESSVIA